jgi:four helix bundle protein
MRLERMRMYVVAEQLVAEVDGLLSRVRRCAPRTADQLERAAESVLFNTAEGIGSFKPGVKINAYDIARKEANEVRAILRRLVIKKVLPHKDVQHATELAGMCVAMLTNAIKSVEARQQ